MENTLALWQRSENFPAANFASNCPCCYLLQTCDYTHSSQTLTFDEKSFSFINIRSCRQRNMKKELFLAGLLWPFVAKKQKAISTQKVVFWKKPTLTTAVTKFKYYWKKGGFPQLLKRPDWRLINCCDLDFHTCETSDYEHCLKRIDLGSMYPLVLTAIPIHFFFFLQKRAANADFFRNIRMALLSEKICKSYIQLWL